MRHKIEHAIGDDHPIHILFELYCLHHAGRVLSGNQFAFTRQILIGEANQAHVNNYTNEKEDDVIQNGVHHSETVEQVTLESHYSVPLGNLLFQIEMAVVYAISIKRVVRVDIGDKIVHFKLENLKRAESQREKTNERVKET